MTPTHHLSRATLRDDVSVRALAPLLLPDKEDDRIAAAHRLVWSLLADDPDRRRDFLWREEAPGRFLILSERAPVDARGLFALETKLFAAQPAAGERFAFALRANPTVALAGGSGQGGKRARGKPVDVVMQALHAIPGRRGAPGAMQRPLVAGEGRAFAREALLGWSDEVDGADPRRPALDWLARQGERHGFEIDRAATRVVAYRRVSLPRGRAAPVVFGQVDYEGALAVRAAGAFHAGLVAGFGRAKAFGCGLMLLARAGAG